MDALDVISLQSAKDNLVVDADDTRITSLIRAAVNWVEVYTGWYLYQREITIYSTSYRTLISGYPVTLLEIKNSKDEILDPLPTPRYGALSFSVCCAPQSRLKLQVGFTTENIGELPAVFIEAAQKLIVYLYENRDMYGLTLPTDIQMLLNPYRRSPTI